MTDAKKPLDMHTLGMKTGDTEDLSDKCKDFIDLLLEEAVKVDLKVIGIEREKCQEKAV